MLKPIYARPRRRQWLIKADQGLAASERGLLYHDGDSDWAGGKPETF